MPEADITKALQLGEEPTDEQQKDALVNYLKSKITDIKTEQVNRGRKEFGSQVEKVVTELGFVNENSLQGPSLVRAAIESFKAQANPDVSKLTEAEMLKLPIFKSAVDTKLKAAADKIALLELEKENAVKELRRTSTISALRSIAINSIGDVVDLGEGDVMDLRLETLFGTLDISKLKIENNQVFKLDGDDIVKDDYGKPVNAMAEMITRGKILFGEKKKQKPSGAGDRFTKDPAPDATYKFKSKDDFDIAFGNEPSVSKRNKMLQDYIEANPDKS